MIIITIIVFGTHWIIHIIIGSIGILEIIKTFEFMMVLHLLFIGRPPVIVSQYVVSMGVVTHVPTVDVGVVIVATYGALLSLEVHLGKVRRLSLLFYHSIA